MHITVYLSELLAQVLNDNIEVSTVTELLTDHHVFAAYYNTCFSDITN